MERTVFPIWQQNKPFTDPQDAMRHEHIEPNLVEDCIDRYIDVTEPTLSFFPASGKAPHPAMLVCPGGGYHHLAWSHEGLDIASLLNINGFSAFVLKYRCPGQRQAAHSDAARAMRFIRAHAEQFRIDPARSGAIGFSAGGHLCATISAPAEPVPYPPTDEVDTLPYRPSFTVLIYPAYLADDDLKIAPEFRIDAQVSPTLLIQAEDDDARVENSLGWYWALKRAGVQAEMHLYAKGGHGYGLLRTGNAVSDWGTLAGSWLRRQAGLR